MTEPISNPDDEFPKGIRGGRAIRAVLNAAGGAIPFVGGAFSAASGAWSEREQEKINSFFEHWLKMLQDEMAEKAQTIGEADTALAGLPLLIFRQVCASSPAVVGEWRSSQATAPP